MALITLEPSAAKEMEKVVLLHSYALAFLKKQCHPRERVRSLANMEPNLLAT